MPERFFGKYVIVRGDRSGVFAGILEEKDGQTVTLSSCRRLWYWSGAASLSQLARDGVKRPNDCKFTITVDTLVVVDAIEIIPTSAVAEANIKAVPEWRV